MEMEKGKRVKEVLPLDVVMNILKRVAVKSLMRWKCVSKEWFNLIQTNPFFIKEQLHHSTLNAPITGTIFWPASMTSGCYYEYVVSFDVRRELFTLMSSPPKPSLPYSDNVFAVWNDELVMFRHYMGGNIESCSIDLWVLKDFNGDYDNDRCYGGGENWVKMYTVGPFTSILKPLTLWRDEIVFRDRGRFLDMLYARRGMDSGSWTGMNSVIAFFNPVSKEFKKKQLQPPNNDEVSYVPFTYVESLVSLSKIALPIN